MKVITVATHASGYFESLQSSCSRLDYDVKVLGWNQTWTGLTMKFRCVLDYLQTNPDQLSKDEIIVVVDAFDVLLLQSPTYITQEYTRIFKNRNHRPTVIFGKDPANLFNSLIYDSPTFQEPFPCYINSGVYIGHKQHVQTLLSKICQHGKCKQDLEDQHLLNIYYKTYRDPFIYIDFSHRLIYNLPFFQGSSRWSTFKYYWNTFVHHQRPCVSLPNTHFTIDEKNKRLVLYDDDQTQPAILHANGNVNIDELCRSLQLPVEQQTTTTFHQYNGWNTVKTFLVRRIALYLHIVFSIFMITFPLILLFWKQCPPWVILGFIVFCCGLVTQWYMFRQCILRYSELKYDYEHKPFMMVLKSTRQHFILFSCIPFFSIIWSILVLCYRFRFVLKK